jgi:Ser/Thr protein kinase RdoA (MazF antagonist)
MRDAVAIDLRAAGADLSRLATPPAWLRQVANPDLVAAALRRHVPGIRACEVVRVRIKAQAFTAVYRVAVAGAARRPERIVELRGDLCPPGRRPPPSRAEGAFDSPGWSCSLPELHLLLTLGAADAALPALPALTDARLAGELIERAIGQAAAAYAGFRVVSCRLDVARHKPGSRCTVVYDLELPAEAPPGWPRAVVAKTYWGGKGRVAWDGMVALWRCPLGATSTVAIAEPLAFLDEERVLLQRAIPHETTFKEALRTTLADAAADPVSLLRPIVERIALGLAELHQSGAEATNALSWEDELEEVREVAERLALLVPSLGETASGLLSQLERHAGRSSPRAVPSHGSFRPAQVVVDADGRIGFIDFDSFCTSEPAHDVALFCSSLRDTGLRALLERSDDGVGHLAVLDDLCDVFVAAYRSVAPVSPVRVALWETLDVLTAVQHCWTKVKFDRLAYRMALLEHRLARGVDE